MSDDNRRIHPIVEAVSALVGGIVEFAPDSGVGTDLGSKLDVLERVVELGRLATGRLENSIRMTDLLETGIMVRPEGRTVLVGVEPRYGTRGRKAWPTPDPRVPQELQTPLLLHLVHNRMRKRPIGQLLADFIEAITPFLSPLDVESTQTGVSRVATNSRFAARTLRSWGLLRTSREVAFKTWELTHLGVIVGAILVMKGNKIRIEPRRLKTSSSDWLAKPLQEVSHDLRDPVKLRRALAAICIPNADVLASMATVLEILQDYGEVICSDQSPGLSFAERRSKAAALLQSVEEAITPEQLADDIVTDLALRDLLGVYLE